MVKSIGAVALLSLAVFADAHGEQRRHDIHARQNTPGSPSPSSSASAPAASGSGAAPTGAASSTRPALTVTFASTNPTAIPLSSISGDMSSRETIPLASTAAVGAVPSGIVGAPPLPDRNALNPAEYPTPDKIPDLNTPEVDMWWDQVMNSGIEIPEFEPTHPGGCQNATNAAFVADTSRCWWTCGGCVTEDDITECDEKNHWGLTFDDGPGFYTSNLLHYLDEQNLKATFFIVGSRVTTFPATLQTEYANGHQIAVHTWSHKALTTLTNREIVAELGWTKKVIYDTLGVTPNMMRPPFGDIDNRVRAISLAMGLTPVMWTRSPDGRAFNTQDFDIRLPGVTVEKIMNDWQGLLDFVPQLDKGFITLQHDLYQEFVDMATGYIIPDGLAQNPPLTIQPVSTCTKRRLADAYIETNDNSTFPPKAKLSATSPGGPPGAGAGGNADVVSPASIAASLIGGAGFIAGLLF